MLKRRESDQLLLVFADSPQGSKDEDLDGVPSGKSILQQIARARNVKDSRVTGGPPEEGLMEKIASSPNLASALLHVANNRGAPGVDGLSTEEILEAGHLLLNRLSAGLNTPKPVIRTQLILEF